MTKLHKKRYRFKRKQKRKSNLSKNVSNESRLARLQLNGMIPAAANSQGVAGTVNLAWSFALNFPGYMVVDSGTYGTTTWGAMGSAVGVFSTLYLRAMAMYDEYKVLSLTVRYVPNEIDTLANTSIPDVNDTPSLVYNVNDHDDVGIVTNESYFINAGHKPQFTTKVVKRMFKQPANRKSIWLNCGNATLAPTTATTGNNNVGPEAYSAMKFLMPAKSHAAALGATYYYGRFYCYWDVLFRGIQSNN